MRAPLAIAAVIDQAVESTGALFEDKGVRLEVEEPATDLQVDGDRERLVQVVANVLVNAAKFTPSGRRVAVKPHVDARTVTIEVRDEGAGIEPELLPRIFDLFTQGAQTSDRGGGGLGLGLAIAKSVVVAHGGTIQATSPGPGHGATLTVTLPLLATSPIAQSGVAPPSSEEPPPTRRPRVLIVDDNEDGAATLAMILDLIGFETVTAPDGPEALAALAASSFEAAVLDIGLPGMDGYALAAEVRQRLGARSPVLVALTGYAQLSDQRRALASGFNAHFGKPVDADRLAAKLAELLKRE